MLDFFKKNNKKIVEIENPLNNLISPSYIEFKKDYVFINDKILKIYNLYNFPEEVEIKWLFELNKIENIFIKTNITNISDNNDFINILNKKANSLDNKILYSNKANERDLAELEKNSLNDLIRKLNQNNVKLVNANITIGILAKDETELKELEEKLYTLLLRLKINRHHLTFLQKEGFENLSACFSQNKKLQKIYNQVFPNETLIGGLQFLSNKFQDNNGIYFGKDSNKNSIFLNIWNKSGDRTNSNMVILGKSGVGKSTLLQNLYVNEFMLGTGINLIDPEGENIELAKRLGGTVIDCGGGNNKFNIFQIIKFNVNLNQENDDEEDDDGTFYYHLQKLKTILKIYLEIDDEKYNILEKIIIKMYKNFGISSETTDFTKFKNTDFPTFTNLYEEVLKELENIKDDDRTLNILNNLKNLLQSAYNGSDSYLLNGHTTVFAENDFTVFNIKSLIAVEPKLQEIQYYQILLFLWDKITKKNGNNLIGLDEGYMLIDKKNPFTLDLLKAMEKRIRKYNGAFFKSVQSPVDFLAESIKTTGIALLDQPTYKIIFGMDGNDLNTISDLYKLTQSEINFLENKIQREAICFLGNKKIKTSFELFNYKFEYFGKVKNE